LIGCANVVLPSGGEKDTSPPKIITTDPPNQSVNFNDRKIIIEFNEYIQIKNNNIRISPLCDPPPKINIKGKKLEINMECSLMESTTYTINLGKKIMDLNEGNILNNYKYVFSTGLELDSLNVRGSVTEMYHNKKSSNTLVGLYQNMDSINPYYYTFTNESGEFLIDNIAKNNFMIFAFKDENVNLKYDVGEMISIPRKIENFNNDLNIDLFYEEFSDEIINAENIHRNAILFEHNTTEDSILVLNAQGIWYKDNYSSMFWFHQSPPFIKYQFNNIVDSVQIFNKDSVDLKLDITSSIEDYYNKKIVISSNTPIKNLNKNLINWENSNKNVNLSIIDFFQIHIDVNINTDIPQTLILHKGAIQLTNNSTNDSIGLVFKYEKNDYGAINIKCNNCKKNTVIELFNSNGVVKKSVWLDSLKFKFINPGEYNLRVFEDINENYFWNSGKINPTRDPEPIQIYPDKIKIRANWEIDILIK
tara:strand:+ start:226 stop:1653 length:1428 start_codon:yes stop_codon:yes gene_type:complete